jgi:glutamyl-tRNA synthetase
MVGCGQEEFEHAILEDLALLRITPDQITWTSDWFPQCVQLAEDLLRRGQAYVDDTPVEQVRGRTDRPLLLQPSVPTPRPAATRPYYQMRDERLKSIASKARDLPVEENLRRWEEMKAGTDFVRGAPARCLRSRLTDLAPWWTNARARRAACGPRST